MAKPNDILPSTADAISSKDDPKPSTADATSPKDDPKPLSARPVSPNDHDDGDATSPIKDDPQPSSAARPDSTDSSSSEPVFHFDDTDLHAPTATRHCRLSRASTATSGDFRGGFDDLDEEEIMFIPRLTSDFVYHLSRMHTSSPPKMSAEDEDDDDEGEEGMYHDSEIIHLSDDRQPASSSSSKSTVSPKVRLDLFLETIFHFYVIKKYGLWNKK